MAAPTIARGRVPQALHGTPEHIAWQNMLRRCFTPTNPAFKNYGGRGIAVCDRWREFAAFFADMGPRPTAQHSLDRIDNNEHYKPGNCRWATKIEQTNNTRQNRWITFDGRTMTLTRWAREVGLDDVTIYHRIKHGWHLERALTESSHPPQVTAFGKTLTLSGWAQVMGISKNTLWHRLRHGRAPEEALTDAPYSRRRGVGRRP